jgi:hypothetical protein
MRRNALRDLLVLALPLAALGCPERPSTGDALPSSASSASAVPSASAAAPASASSWYVGSWAGGYTARPFRVKLDKQGDGLPSWTKDDGTAASGAGRVTVVIDASRRVLGSAQGPLGELLVVGELDGETLRAQLQPKEPAALGSFAGSLVLRRQGEKLEGRLQASTGDSQTVRDAPVQLERATAPSPAGVRPRR